MAAISPMAVANSASAMEGATTARDVFFWMAIDWKAFMMPQTVPNSPIKGDAVATMASEPRPSSRRAFSRAMAASSTRSIRWIRKAAWPSVLRPLLRASRHSRSAPCSMRGKAFLGRSPAAVATSSRLLPEATSSSKALAWRESDEKRKILSRMIVHDQSDAPPRPTMTSFTTQSAFMNRTKKLRLSGETAAVESMRGQELQSLDANRRRNSVVALGSGELMAEVQIAEPKPRRDQGEVCGPDPSGRCMQLQPAPSR